MPVDSNIKAGDKAGDWLAAPMLADLEPEAMRCPRCEYGVYGLPEPRCPDCGERFTAEEVRSAARGRRGLFEHQCWRDPIRSLLRTWWLAAFRPRRFWRMCVRADRPDVWPLLMMVVVQWMVFRHGWWAMGRVVRPVMNTLLGWTAPNVGWTFVYRWREDPDYFTRILLAQAGTFLALQLFFDTGQRYGFRWRHTLRIFVHASFLAALCPALWCLAEAVVDATILLERPIQLVPGGAHWREQLQNVYLPEMFRLTVLGSLWYGIWLGYRVYLRARFGAVIAGLSIVVGFLASELVMLGV